MFFGPSQACSALHSFCFDANHVPVLVDGHKVIFGSSAAMLHLEYLHYMCSIRAFRHCVHHIVVLSFDIEVLDV